MKSKHGTNASQPVYEYLKNMILSCEMKPGDRIPEQKIADDLNVSRTPIREAINQLANDGLIRIYPQRYSEVMSFTEEDIYHMGEMRIALEMMSAKLALYHSSLADFNRLGKLAEACNEASKSGNAFALIQADAAFHLAFTECTKNPLLYKFQRELCLRVQLIQANSSFTEAESDELVDYHREIVKCLQARDLKAIYALIGAHFNQFYKLDQVYPKDFFNLFDVQTPSEVLE